MCVDRDVVDAVDVGGLRIAFQREGRGPPLMLLHGFVGDGGRHLGLSARGAVDAFTVIAWDCPGAGHSSAVPESFPLADYGWARSKARRNPERPSAYVAGLSFGAVLALELFRRHGEVPQRLISASAYAGWGARFVPTSSRSACAGAWRCPGSSGRVRRRDAAEHVL
jgi:pimeloyl-ACP methyl ester carboxylesterase